MSNALRNIAIIAHVDHGKTTLVDHMLRQTGVFRSNESVGECILDSNDLEKERGITILSKNASVRFRDTKINIIDTPGHHDFGGEVERVLHMASGALVLVDAVDGPMPQTRYVLQKALDTGLALILVINKMDRREARPREVLDDLQYLLLELDATQEQLDAPVLYAIGRQGRSRRSIEDPWTDLTPLFECILEHIPAPQQAIDAPFALGVSTLEYDDYVGRMAVGRVSQGILRKEDSVFLIKPDGRRIAGSIVRLETFENLDRRGEDEVRAGEIVRLAGLPEVDLGDTIAAREDAEPLPFLSVDEPTMSMNFLVNDSPLSGMDGEFLTSTYLRNRLMREALADPALRVETTDSPDRFRVSGRGLLHLSILIERMRRDGFELQLSRLEIIFRTVKGRKMEPVERAEVSVPGEYLGPVLTLLGTSRAQINTVDHGQERVHVTARIPTRTLM
ncbi:MAG: GTP-binding protein, partial [Planctomycetota bacterium]